VEKFQTFQFYLGTYLSNFKCSVDELWDEKDVDKNGVLDKTEALTFLQTLQ